MVAIPSHLMFNEKQILSEYDRFVDWYKWCHRRKPYHPVIRKYRRPAWAKNY